MAEQRHYNNHLPMGTPLDDESLRVIPKAAAAAIKKIKHTTLAHQDISGGSVYVGAAGIGFMYMKIYEHVHAGVTFSDKYLRKHTEDHNLQLAAQFIAEADKIMPKLKRVTFLEGYAGVLALQAALAAAKGEARLATDKAEALERYYEEAITKLPPGECELMNGRAGYLYACLWTKERVGKESISNRIIKELVRVLLEEGTSQATQASAASGGTIKYGLLYSWNDKLYLGAAHGLCGVLMVLLQCLPQVREVDPTGNGYRAIQLACDSLATCLLPSGNLPSRPGSENDKLVQWCHGAPGLIPLLVCAHNTLSDDGHYLAAAHRAANAVWQRGLLKKGVGLCHGIAGNAYGFLSLYRATQDQRYLSCAQQFAAYMAQHWDELYDNPDRAASLFEGLAGAVCLWLDVMSPDMACFPAYEL